MKHTKLPWETDGTIDGFTKVCVGPEKEAIGWIDFESKNDLAYALLACNTHERLVEALKRLVAIHRMPGLEQPGSAVEQALAALDACEVG